MRLFTAIAWFFKILSRGNAAFEDSPREAKPAFAGSKEPAVQLLALFQKEGRLVDFLKQDIAGFPDADIGAVARDVHRGCRKVLDERFTLRRIAEGEEGAHIVTPSADAWNPSHYELIGNVRGDAPYSGPLAHAGWIVEEVRLPTVAEGADAMVIAPAQVEVS